MTRAPRGASRLGETMIISNKIEQYDDVWRLVTYDTDDSGKCRARYVATEMQEEINTFYVQQAERLKNLQEKLLAGTISPIGFYFELYRMDVKDVAARLRVGKGTVKKHLSPKGFGSIKVDTLKKYAQIFDVSVGDFFSLISVPGAASIKLENYHERLLQHVTISDSK
jgi:transcriptional regulator with XRE-family HTH domain